MRVTRWAAAGLVCLGLMATPASRAGAATQCAAARARLPGLLQSEYAFADRARSSVRSAFLEYLAEDSLVLQPGPTPGRPFYRAAKESADTLAWYPTTAALAADDDLGFTSGPWTYTPAGGGPPAQGHFLSIWKRDSDCRWRVVFDGGVSHGHTQAAVVATATVAPATVTAVPADIAGAESITRVMTDFQSTVQENGVPAGLRTYALIPDFRLYLQGELPMAVTAATHALSKDWTVGAWREAARGGSADASLAYSVGEFTDAKGRTRHAYAQIWQYDPRIANWGLRVLLIVPLPKK